MFWLDNPSGVPQKPAEKPIHSLTRLYFTEGGNGQAPSYPGEEWFNMVQEELLNVVTEADISPEKTNRGQIVAAIRKISKSNYFSAGLALPTTNIGPIWHDDYGGWMHWQEFTQNGADYHGYASLGIGSVLLDTQPTPRQGYIKSGVQNLSRITYAALRAWALHHGRMVAPATWQAGQIVCADNTDGTTFRVYDVRGEFLRVFDDGRGADPSRAFGSWQNGTHITGDDLVAPAVHGIADIKGADADPGDGVARTFYYVGATSNQTDNYSWRRVRPRNTALLAAIKY